MQRSEVLAAFRDLGGSENQGGGADTSMESMISPLVGINVIMHKLGEEVSLVEQDTIEYVS